MLKVHNGLQLWTMSIGHVIKCFQVFPLHIKYIYENFLKPDAHFIAITWLLFVFNARQTQTCSSSWKGTVGRWWHVAACRWQVAGGKWTDQLTNPQSQLKW